MRRIWVIVLLVVLCAVPAAAQSGPSLRWARYDNIVDVAQNGDLTVTEQQQIVVTQGPLRRMTRTFDLSGAQASNIEVLEDNTPYTNDAGGAPGTFSATSNGASVSVRLLFRNPNAAQHNLQIRYTLQDALVASNPTQALLDWRFFWGDNAPPTEAGSVAVQFPAAVDNTFQFDVGGAPVAQNVAGNTVRWDLTQQLQGQQVRIQATFPQTVLAPNVTLRAPGSGVVASPDTASNGGSGVTVPNQATPDGAIVGAPGTAVGGFASLLFCVVGLVVLFIVFAMIRASARGRTRYGQTYGPAVPPVIIEPDPFGMGRRRRRRYGGIGGGFFPPIFIPPPSPPRDSGAPWGGSPFDPGSGGGGSSWGDSGGGGSSWGDSGGGGSSWGDSGGGGSAWGGGGGGSSWGGGGDSSGGGGDSSGGGGGSGGGSFG